MNVRTDQPTVARDGTEDRGAFRWAGSVLPFRPESRKRRLRCDLRDLTDGAVLLHIRGDVDLLTADPLRSLLARLVAGSTGAILLDLSDVAFLGVKGVAILLDTTEDCRRRGTELRLVNISHAVRRPLTTLGLLDSFDIVGAADHARHR